MNVVYKLFCRAYQAVFRALIPVLPYRQPQQLDRVEQVPEILKKLSLDRVLLVTDAGLTAPLEAALAASGIACTVYADTRANPTVQNVEDAFALYREHRCTALIALGGGSAALWTKTSWSAAAACGRTPASWSQLCWTMCTGRTR